MKIVKKIMLCFYYIFARHLPYQPIPGYRLGNFLRKIVAKICFKKVGANIVIKSKAYFGDGKNIQMGNYSQLGINCKVENDLVLGDYVLMGPDVIIYSSSHEYSDIEVPVMFQGGKLRKSVTIGNDVWIGTRCIIMPGVTIGNHVIIGANSVVTHDIPDYAVACGAPAKIVKYRNKK